MESPFDLSYSLLEHYLYIYNNVVLYMYIDANEVNTQEYCIIIMKFSYQFRIHELHAIVKAIVGEQVACLKQR